MKLCGDLCALNIPSPLQVALGRNFCLGCLFSTCCPVCPNVVQRQAVAKKHGLESNMVEDVALSCCCGLCVVVQDAVRMGDDADVSNFKTEYLFKPPTKQDGKLGFSLAQGPKARWLGHRRFMLLRTLLRSRTSIPCVFPVEAMHKEAASNAAGAKTENPLAAPQE